MHLYVVLERYVVIHMISKNEHGKTDYRNRSGRLIGVITANELETQFFFYEFDGKNYKKLGKAGSPPELERKFKLDERVKQSD